MAQKVATVITFTPRTPTSYRPLCSGQGSFRTSQARQPSHWREAGLMKNNPHTPFRGGGGRRSTVTIWKPDRKSLLMVQNVRYSNGLSSHVTLPFKYWTPILSGILMNPVFRCTVWYSYSYCIGIWLPKKLFFKWNLKKSLYVKAFTSISNNKKKLQLLVNAKSFMRLKKGRCNSPSP